MYQVKTYPSTEIRITGQIFVICSQSSFFHSLEICVDLLLLSVFNFTLSGKLGQPASNLGFMPFTSFMKLNTLYNKYT